MTFVEAVRTGLGKAVTFSGRASRPEFWWFALAWIVFLVLLDRLRLTLQMSFNIGGGYYALLVELASLLLQVPLLAAGWRRLHDTGLPGWPMLVPFAALPLAFILFFVAWGIADSERPDLGFVGTVAATSSILLPIFAFAGAVFLLSRPSNPGPNKYGPNPCEVTP